MEKKRSRGRPRLPAGEARTERVVAFLRPADLATIEQMAAQRGVEVGAVAREIVERSLARRRKS